MRGWHWPRPVVVRWAHLDGAPERPEAADRDPAGLSPAELERWRRLRDPGDRLRFTAARALLRETVAGQAGCNAADVAISQRCARCGEAGHGRPTVTVAGRPGPHVSFAHAADLVVVALADAPVGIDAEPDGPGELRTWVRTEAVLKATGHGLALDPGAVGLGDPRLPPRLIRWEGPGRMPRVELADLAVAGHVVSVARLGRHPLLLDRQPAPSRSGADPAPERI